MQNRHWMNWLCCLALTALFGCADVPLDDDAEVTEGDVQLGVAENDLIEKVVYRSINAGDPPAVYYGVGNIEVKLTNGSKYGAAVEVRNKSGTPVNIDYAKITVKCQNGAGDWTWTSYPGKLNGGGYWGHVQLCYEKLLSASIEVKIVRP